MDTKTAHIQGRDEPVGELVETTLDELVKKARAEHLEIAPVFLEHEQGKFLVIRHTHGFYSLTEHLDGGVLLLYSHDYAHFNPLIHADAAFREQKAPGYWLNPAQSGHIEIVAARDARDGEKWALAEINKHNYYKMQDLERFGYLWHPSHNLFESGAIIYKSEAGTDKDHELISCYTSEGKEQEFTSLGLTFMLEKQKSRLLSIGTIKALLPVQTKNKEIVDDFVKRTSLVNRGIDPSRLGFLPKEPHLQSTISPAGKGLFRRFGLNVLIKVGLGRFFQTVYTQLVNGKASNNIMNVSKALAQATGHFIMRGVVAGAFTMLSAIARPMGLTYMRMFLRSPLQSLFHLGNNVASRYGCDQHLAIDGEGYYHRLNKDQAHLCRFLHPDETAPYPFANATTRESVREDFAAHRLLDPYGGPPGTLIEERRINDMDVLRLMQPDGIELYILPGKQTAYARYRPDMVNKAAQPMPQKIRTLFAEHGHHLRVFAQDGHVHHETLDYNKFIAGLHAETVMAERPAEYPEPMHSIKTLQEEWQRTAPPKETLKRKIKRSCLSRVLSTCQYFNKCAAPAKTNQAACVNSDAASQSPALSQKMAEAVKNVTQNAAQGGEEWAVKQLQQYEDENMGREALERVLRRKVKPPQDQCP